jgi:hypothetical protein
MQVKNLAKRLENEYLGSLLDAVRRNRTRFTSLVDEQV